MKRCHMVCPMCMVPVLERACLPVKLLSLMRTSALALGAIRQRWTKHEGAAVMKEQ